MIRAIGTDVFRSAQIARVTLLALHRYYITTCIVWDGSEVFNVGLATHWAFANGLGVNLKIDPEAIGLAILFLKQVVRPSLCQGTPIGIFDRELGRHCTYNGFYMH